jgi:release factor glutamine methyltransferase
MTVRDALREGAAALAGSETPFLDASLILADALSMDRSELLASGPEELDPGASRTYMGRVAERARGVPVAYILGRKEFWGRSFRVDQRVLIPRPDTEALVEAALALGDAILRERGGSAGLASVPRARPEPALRVHDACAGSGCVAISIAAERPGWIVSASDISPGALELARENAADLVDPARPGGPVAFSRSDLLAGVGGAFDLIASNPPYVESDVTTRLLALGWEEPRSALDGGEDGLDLIRALVPQAAAALSPGGALAIEADPGQAGAVAELLRASRLAEVGTEPDLAGRPRVTTGRKPWTS